MTISTSDLEFRLSLMDKDSCHYEVYTELLELRRKLWTKPSREALADFNNDCLQAASSCPQYRGGYFKEADILRGNVKAKEVMSYWSDCETLWRYGYCEGLPKEAFSMILRYRASKAIQKSIISER